MSRKCPGRNHRVGMALLMAVLCMVVAQRFAVAYGAEPATVGLGSVESVTDTTATIELAMPSTKAAELNVAVFYGKEDGGAGKKTDWEQRRDLVGKPEKTFSLELEELEPDTQYFYRVCTDDTTWSELGKFRTGEWTMPWYVFLLVVVGLLTVPFIAGGHLARRFRMPDHGWKIGLILCTLASGVVIVLFSFLFRDGPKLGIDLSGGLILVYEVDQTKKADDRPVDMDKLIAAVSRRVNPGGIKEITIRKYGAERIEIIIPKVGAEEAQRIEKLVSRAGTLEFRILANRRDHDALIKRAASENSTVLRDSQGKVEARWVPLYEGEKPTDKERVQSILSYPEIAKRPGKKGTTEILVVKDTFDVTGAYLTHAMPDWDRTGNRCVGFAFDRRGARLFGGLTGNNLPDEVQQFTRKLGIILDGELYSAPAIKAPIFDRGVIEGSFTAEEVEDLVNVLNAGSLPTALAEEPISKLFTGPTLGRDTIEKGKVAIAVSMVLVLVFMLFYYRFAGIVACGALLINLVLILAVMIAIGAAFTLPGLAGLVLTVGMAVDANVLVFERIREELSRGAALRMAIRNGFSRATTTIVDANLTTLITATVLYVIGTDQVRGFAVVLWLGVVMSMYTAIFCSRVVFDIAERRRRITRLKMMRMLGGTRIDFLGKRRLAAAASLAVIVIGLVGVSLRGPGLLDIDFTGGVSVETLFKKTQNIAEVRERLSGLPDLAVSDVQTENDPAGVRFMINTSQKPEIDENDPNKIKKTAILVVEDHIHIVFGDELAANSMAYDEVRPVGEEVAEKAARERPTKPGPTGQTRNDLPDDSVLVLAQPAPVLPAQTDSPEEKPSTAEAAADEPSSQAAPEKTPDDIPDGPPKATPDDGPTEPAADPFAGGTQARLAFTHAVGYDTLKGLFVTEFGSEDAVPSLELIPLLEPSKPGESPKPDPDYVEGDNTAYSIWDVKIKLPPEQAKSRLDSVQARVADTPLFPSSNTIGGKVAGNTRTLAVTALVASLLCIVAYIWIRFQRVIFGLAAVVALVHDVLVTLGVIALSYWLAGPLGFLLVDPFKIGLPVLAAFLTIIGYSLNDTIVVFDRIREVRGKSPRLTQEMVNISINQTLARTLLTSLTTLLVVIILYVRGGQGIHAFAFSLVIGVIVGTYSSIFVASPALLWMSRPSRAK